MMGHYRLHWDAEIGWILDVDATISDRQLMRVCQWAFIRQVDRWRGLPQGPKKDELAAAILQLASYKIQQRLTQQRDGTATLFKATAGTGKIISVGGI